MRRTVRSRTGFTVLFGYPGNTGEPRKKPKERPQSMSEVAGVLAEGLSELKSRA